MAEGLLGSQYEQGLLGSDPLAGGYLRQPEMRAYTPTLRERMTNAMSQWMGDDRASYRSAGRVMDVLDLTPVGMATTAYDAGRMMDSPAGVAGGTAMLGAMAFPPARAAVKKGIRAYHGSPHDFDKFSMERIGTGEGAQAYGHGLYFAEKEGTARAYRDTLSGGNLESRNFFDASAGAVLPDIGNRTVAAINAAQKTTKHPDHAGQIVDHIVSAMKEGVRPEDYLETYDVPKQFRQAFEDAAESLSGIEYRQNPGRMYEVNIKADPGDFLDWDKPLSEQSPAIQEYGKRVMAERSKGSASTLYNDPNKVMALQGQFVAPRDPEAMKILREAGIPGIKYLDQGSRTGGEGTRNFVLFRDDIIDIVKKYGIAGAAAMLGVSQADVSQAMENPRQPGR